MLGAVHKWRHTPTENRVKDFCDDSPWIHKYHVKRCQYINICVIYECLPSWRHLWTPPFVTSFMNDPLEINDGGRLGEVFSDHDGEKKWLCPDKHRLEKWTDHLENKIQMDLVIICFDGPENGGKLQITREKHNSKLKISVSALVVL